MTTTKRHLRSQLGKTLAVVAIWAGVGCATHEPVSAFRSTVFIDDRGISVPLPPPSLTAEPVQEVEIEGEIGDADAIENGAVVHAREVNSGAEVVIELDSDASGFVAQLEFDLSDNCLEFWVEQADGEDGTPRSYSASITVDDEIEVVEGCDQG